MLDFSTNNILLIMVALWVAGQFYYAIALRPNFGKGWLALTVLVLAVMGTGLYSFPRHVGLVCGLLVLVFATLPLLGQRRLSRLVIKGNHDAAYRWAWILAILHPADGYLFNVELMNALRRAAKGEFTVAEQLQAKLADQQTPSTLSGAMALLRTLGRWEEMVALAQTHRVDRQVRQMPMLAFYSIRAYAETGRLAEAVLIYRHFRQDLSPRLYEALRYRGADLFLAAFAGRVRHTEKLLESMASHGTTTHDFWLQTARLARGEEANDELRRLLEQETNVVYRQAITRRLGQDLAVPVHQLSVEDEALLDEMEREVGQSRRYSAGATPLLKPYVTYALAALIGLVFILENIDYSYHKVPLQGVLWLGTLKVRAVLAGQWWRLLTHLFLHLGWPHVILNLLALLYFGPFLERSLGRWRYLLCYLVSGVGAALILVLLAHWGFVSSRMILVGASGAIMGLVGATGTVLWRGWRKEAAALARRRFFGIVNILFIQIVFDQMFPQVSSLIHVLGFGLGVALTLMLQQTIWPRSASPQG